MKIDFHIPKEPLKGFVKSIMCYEDYSGPDNYELLIPDTSPQLIISLDENSRFVNTRDCSAANFQELKNSWITGIYTSPLTYQSEQNATTLSIQFESYGLSYLLGISAAELNKQVVETELILNKSIIELREKIIDQSTFENRVRVIEEYLFKTFQAKKDITGIVKHITQHRNFSQLTLKRMSTACGYSQKHVIANFRHVIGVTPKKLQNLLKINQSLALLSSQSPASIAQIAYDCGFFDQSHFIKNFKEVTSLTPQAYIKKQKKYPHVISFN